YRRRRLTRAVHLAKAHNVPEFCRKVAAFFDLFFVEPNVLPSRRDVHHAKTQTVGAIFVDQLEWIRRITERLRHLPPQLVANQASEQNVVKWNVVFDLFSFAGLEFEAGDDHPRHPEENDVWRGYEHTGGIKFLPRLVIHSLISPQPRGKPGIERVFILNPVFRIRRRLDADVNFPAGLGFGIWGLGFSIPRRYAVSPPYLPANAPVADVLQPLSVNFLPMHGKKSD